MKRRGFIAGVATAASTTVTGCAEEMTGTPVTESFSDSYTVSRETRVLISNRNGPVSVRPSTTDELTIAGEKRADVQNGLDSITIDVVEGERFVINVRFSTGSDASTRRVDLSVGIPDGVAVDTANTGNGDVTVTSVRGNLNAATADGDVEVTDVSGFVRGETTNGNVRLWNCTGVSGARTSSGTVDVEVQRMRDDVTCYASSGDVTVRVGPGVSAAVRLSTNAGNVSVRDLPFTPEIDRRGYLVGSLRGGTSPLLFLGSNGGDLTLMPA